MDKKMRAVTVKLDNDLYQVVSDVSALTGVTIRELLAGALQREAERARKNPRMRETLDRMRDFREESIPI